MAVVNSISRGDTDPVLSFILPFASICTLVFVVLGIKLKWFRHRLTFEQVPTAPEQQRDDSGIQIRSYYRHTTDIDNFVNIERPKELPPVRVTNSRTNNSFLPPVRKPAPQPQPIQNGVAINDIPNNFYGEPSNRKRSSEDKPELPKSLPPNLVPLDFTDEKIVIIPQIPKNQQNNSYRVKPKLIPPPPNYTPPSPIKLDTVITFPTATPTTPVLITSTSNHGTVNTNGYAVSMPNLPTTSTPTATPTSTATNTPVAKPKSGFFKFSSKSKESKDPNVEKSNKTKPTKIKIKKVQEGIPTKQKSKQKPDLTVTAVAQKTPVPAPRSPQIQQEQPAANQAMNPALLAPKPKTPVVNRNEIAPITQQPTTVKSPVLINPITEIKKGTFKKNTTPTEIKTEENNVIDTPLTFATMEIKPKPRTTGIIYSQNDDINDEITIITPAQRTLINNNTVAEKSNNNTNNSYNNQKDYNNDNSSDEDDDIWNRIANQKRARGERTVMFNIPPNRSKSTPSLVDASNETNNTSLVIEKPKTLREMHRAQKMNVDTDRKINQNTFKLADDNEDSDTEV